eukprot:jgi/Botrbrau1/10844/Bobra.0025s0023.1
MISSRSILFAGLLGFALFCGLARGQSSSDVSQMFDALDRNKDGVVDWNEFKMIFYIADKNGDGKLDTSEFPEQTITAITQGKGNSITVDQFKVMFDAFDVDHTGQLTKAEFTNPGGAAAGRKLSL